MSLEGWSSAYEHSRTLAAVLEDLSSVPSTDRTVISLVPGNSMPLWTLGMYMLHIYAGTFKFSNFYFLGVNSVKCMAVLDLSCGQVCFGSVNSVKPYFWEVQVKKNDRKAGMHFDLGFEVCLSLCWVLLAVWSSCLDSLLARGSWEMHVKAWGLLCHILCLLPYLLLSHLLPALRSSSPHWRLQSKLGKCIVMKSKTREKRIWSKAKQTKVVRKK